MRRVFVAVLVLLVVLVTELHVLTSTNLQQSSKPAETITEVPLCQVMKEPGLYDHKLIKVTGFFSQEFEDSSINDPTCNFPLGVWFEYGGTKRTGTKYCCGVTTERVRPEPIMVEGVPIPLVVDAKFKSFDTLLMNRGSIHASVVGRFFAGKVVTNPNGTERWRGYGHMGCCSLLMLQQVTDVDVSKRAGLDYQPSPEQPDTNKSGCGYDFLMEDDLFQSQIADQTAAVRDKAPGSLTILNALRQASSLKFLKRILKVINLRLIQTALGRLTYQWKPTKEKDVYTIIVSRPYILSYYSKTDKVAWVAIAAYRSSCDGNTQVRQIN